MRGTQDPCGLTAAELRQIDRCPLPGDQSQWLKGLLGSASASAAYAHFNAVSTAQSNLKTAMSGAYHSIKFAKYAHRYLAESQNRFNRRFDMRSIFARLACVACGSFPKNRRLIRAAEVGC